MDTHGPLFDGTADRIAEEMCQEIEREVGDVGVGMVRAQLGNVLKHPTGRYSSHITAEPDGGDTRITDQDMVYGPWLEGTGSRNRTTRFKGYATFRKVAEALRARSGAIGDQVAQPYIGRMG